MSWCFAECCAELRAGRRHERAADRVRVREDAVAAGIEDLPAGEYYSGADRGTGTGESAGVANDLEVERGARQRGVSDFVGRNSVWVASAQHGGLAQGVAGGIGCGGRGCLPGEVAGDGASGAVHGFELDAGGSGARESRPGFRCGHEAIWATLHDGVKLPRVFREAGFKTDVFDATDVAVCRMYRNAGEVWRGLAKSATEGLGSPRLIVPTTVVLLAGALMLPVSYVPRFITA